MYCAMSTTSTLLDNSAQSPKLLGRESLGMAANLAIAILCSSIAAKFFIPNDDFQLTALKFIWVGLIDTAIFLSISVIYGESWLMVLKLNKEANHRVNYFQRSFMAVAGNCLLAAFGLATLQKTDWGFNLISILTLGGVIIVCLPIPTVFAILHYKDGSLISAVSEDVEGGGDEGSVPRSSEVESEVVRGEGPISGSPGVAESVV
ncbi:hypothetical protein L2E82_37133 [Cichorium intybus]|uniref:Uncharacterized protein n=1 Tax=Cichorium intybus TaxID=13427 RepID=A0ACB9AE13_CICIN|nr:hypothetical protein L2E82_37133 [Cichorium intybus]